MKEKRIVESGMAKMKAYYHSKFRIVINDTFNYRRPIINEKKIPGNIKKC